MYKKSRYQSRCLMGDQGLTLMELIIAMAVFAILGGIAVPKFQEQVQRHRFQSASMELYSIFIFTKSEAIRQGRDVGLSVEGDTVTVFLDADKSKKLDEGDTILRTFALSNAIRILDIGEGSNKKAYVFNHRGMTTHWGTLAFEGGGGRKKIVVSSPGHIKIDAVSAG